MVQTVHDKVGVYNYKKVGFDRLFGGRGTRVLHSQHACFICGCIVFKILTTMAAITGEVKTLMIQLMRGVAHLHDNWIIHRDLKTSNLLLSHKGILKVSTLSLQGRFVVMIGDRSFCYCPFLLPCSALQIYTFVYLMTNCDCRTKHQ